MLAVDPVGRADPSLRRGGPPPHHHRIGASNRRREDGQPTMSSTVITLRLPARRAERAGGLSPPPPYLLGHVLVPRAVEPARRAARPDRVHAPAQPRAGDRRRAGGAGHDDHRHRIHRRRQDRHRAAADGSTYVELYPANRTDADIIADQKKDQAATRRRAKRKAAAIPEARKTARDVSDDRALHGRSACALGEAARGQSAPNPNVGCVIVSRGGRIVGTRRDGAGRPAARRGGRARPGRQAGARARPSM